MKNLLLLILLLSASSVLAQDHGAYTIFNSKGKKVSYKKMLKQIDQTDIILFGEYHNNPISHWLQLELTMSLHKDNSLVLGAEMLESDNQIILDKYMADTSESAEMDSLIRLWPNYDTDYKPLVEFAKKNNLKFVAANVPRTFARTVFRGGFEALDTLSAEQRSWMAPLPIPYDPELPGYVAMLEMMGGHGGENLPKAQAIKDATMAHFILANYKEGQTFIHYNGAYHSNNYEGILWYLKQSRPNLNYGTISTVSQADISRLEKENKGLADFIICVDEDMTVTH